MRKSGLTLIELMFGLGISMGVMSLLFTAFFQINRVSDVAQDLFDWDIRIGILNNQLERDISGIFIPVQVEAPIAAADQKDKPKERPVKNIFYSSNKENSLQIFTFISNNPVSVFSKEQQQIAAKPRVVRIVYRLAQSTNLSGAFVLTRQEGTDLDFDNYDPKTSKFKAYELADGIKSIKISFQFPIINDKKDQQAKAIEYKTLTSWDEKELFKDAKNSTKQPRIAQYISMEIILWDAQKERERTYSLHFTVGGFEGQKLLFATTIKQTSTMSQPEKSTEQSAPATSLTPTTTSAQQPQGSQLP